MVSSLPYGIYFYIIYGGHSINLPSKERDTLLWTHFSKIHTMTSVTFHSISIWLTVYLACFRYIYLKTSTPSASSNLTRSNQNQNKYILNLSKWISNFFTRFKTYNSTIISIAIIYLFCIIFCLPAYLYPTVRQHTIDQVDPSNKTNSNAQQTISFYVVDQSDLNIKTNGSIFKIMFYSQAFLGKFIPCLLLVVFSSLLLYTLIVINRNKKKLLSKSNHSKHKTNSLKFSIFRKPFNFISKKFEKTVSNNEIHRVDSIIELDNLRPKIVFIKPNEIFLGIQRVKKSNSTPSISNSLPNLETDGKHVKNKIIQRSLSEVKLDNNQKMENNTSFNIKTSLKRFISIKRFKYKIKNHTTLMLILVCILFLISEFPQSILIFLSIVLGNDFYNDVYLPLGDLMDIIALINNSINFIIYCSMSKAFRDTFYKIVIQLIPCFLRRNFI